MLAVIIIPRLSMNNKPALDTPVAFLIFNRPEVTFRVFEQIARQRPRQLLIVADGPRSPEEKLRCNQARSILEKVTWECEVLTNFSDTNLGCKRRVSSGLDWVFSQVEEAIILEDDCLPCDSFFKYCTEMLTRYRDDERVMAITGSNLQDGLQRTEHSYYFSKLMLVWGWASWRRAWQHYDVDMKTWPEFQRSGCLQAYCDGPEEEAHWMNTFDTAYRGQIDTWDFQWFYTCWAQSGFTVTPNTNLISNIGFGPEATHTTSTESPLSERGTQEMDEITHPPLVARHREADLYTVRRYFMPPTPPPHLPPVEAPEPVEPERLSAPQQVLQTFLRGLLHK